MSSDPAHRQPIKAVTRAAFVISQRIPKHKKSAVPFSKMNTQNNIICLFEGQTNDTNAGIMQCVCKYIRCFRKFLFLN